MLLTLKCVIELRQGAKGRWRWFLLDHDDAVIAQSPVSGWATAGDAERGARIFLDTLDVYWVEIRQQVDGG